jgi:hypothetical protein
MGPMDRFIRAQNVRRYRSLLQRTAEEADREKLLILLTEEEQKQKDAGEDEKVRPRFRFSNQGGEL